MLYSIASSSSDSTGFFIFVACVAIAIVFFKKIKTFTSGHDSDSLNEDEEKHVPRPEERKKVDVGYEYERKGHLMTASERDFFNILSEIVGAHYYICPQIQLSSILEHRIYHQNWRGALARIHQKSVDYVICDKYNFEPLVAIELDDSTHDLEERQKRDELVEAIFEEAKFPLLRFRDFRRLSRKDLEDKIFESLPNHQNL